MTGPWITTFTGLRVNPLDLKTGDIRILDIAHHLALQNRYAGATLVPVNTAQHSVFVARLCKGELCELQALLHDAPEAYLGDVTKWLKMDPTMAAYRAAEERAWKVIAACYGVPHILSEKVNDADILMARAEMTFVLPGYTFTHPSYGPLTEANRAQIGNWRPWSWLQSEQRFLTYFNRLHERQKHTRKFSFTA